MIHSPFKSLSVDNQALTHEGHFPLDLNCSHVEIYTGTIAQGPYTYKAMYSTKLKVYSAVFTVSQSGCREGLPPISSSFLLPHSCFGTAQSLHYYEDSPSLRGFKTFFYFCTVHVSVCAGYLHPTAYCISLGGMLSRAAFLIFTELHLLHPFFLKVRNFLQWEL